MYRPLVLLTIFVISVNGNEKYLYVFSRDKKSFSDCIEAQLLKENDSYFREHRVVKEIADFVVNKYFETSKSKRELFQGTFGLYFYLKNRKSYLFEDNKNLKSLLVAMREALDKCADLPSIPPIFPDEPRELANVLDFILVDWTDELIDMISRNYDRSILRAYARDAMKRFEIASHYIRSFDNFREEMRRLWRRRAQYYFDGRNLQFPYIRHAYTINRGLHTYGNIFFLSTRSSQDFNDRNPPESTLDTIYFLNMHEADRSNFVLNENNIFSEYDTNTGMTSADYYIETRIDRFYRILYFVRLFEASANLRPEVNDPYYRTIPYDVVSFENQAMVYNDMKYGEILILERNHLNRNLATYSTRSQIEMGVILSSFRIYEEYWNLLTRRIENRNKPGISSTSISVCGSLPHFFWESDELRVVLDLILVDWPLAIPDMVRSRRNRELLRRYSTQTWSVLECYLDSSIDLILFRPTIQEMWLMRAQLYFDGRLDELSYIPHRYTMDRGLCTYAPMNFFYHRSSESLNSRNPSISVNDRIYNFSESQPSTSQDLGSSADYYLQIHIDQFFRIIFFFHFLNSRSTQNDNYDEQVIPEELLQIFDSNDAYGNYLLSLRRHLESTRIVRDEDLSSGLEENLIYMLNLPKRVEPSSSTTTPSSVTISSFTSTTSKYDPSKRKGNFCKNKYGKNMRVSAAAFPEEWQQQHQQNQHKDKYYGYTVINVDAYDQYQQKFLDRHVNIFNKRIFSEDVVRPQIVNVH